MYNAASHAGAESFPVLKAFQDYIEAERAQARKRVMQLSIFFSALMALVVAGFLTAGIFMLRNMSSVQTKLLDVALERQREPAPAHPAVALQTATPALEQSARDLSRAASEMQAQLGQKLDNVSDITAKVNERVAQQDNELERVRTELHQMQEQSLRLREELLAVRTAREQAPPAPQPQPEPPPTAAQTAAIAPPPPQQPLLPTGAQPQPAVAPAAPAAPLPVIQVAAAPIEPPPTPAPIARDPRFPPAVKDPPVRQNDLIPPAPPDGMMATAIPLRSKRVGAVPWRVLIPE